MDSKHNCLESFKLCFFVMALCVAAWTGLIKDECNDE